MNKRILVLGSSSLVGSHFVEAFAKKYEFHAIGRRNIFHGSEALASFETVDLQDQSRLKQVVKKSAAELVINYAAETNVDAAEAQHGNLAGEVYVTNASAVRWVAEACKDSGKVLYQISTDFVFDGSQGPYGEDDPAGPVNNEICWYGYTKHIAEREVVQVLPGDHCIIRVSYPYRSKFRFKTDFARNMLDLYARGRLFPLFADQLLSPTLVDDISNGTDFLIGHNARGIYHIACKDPTTPFDFAKKLISTFYSANDAERNLRKGSIVEFNRLQGKAKRPVMGGLRTERIQHMGFMPKTFEEGVDLFFHQSKTR